MSKRILLGGLALLLVCALPALAGKNNGGAMIVHTYDGVDYTGTASYCDTDYNDPGTCEGAGTQTGKDELTPAVIWLLAAFHADAQPGVTVCYFGIQHNMPSGQGYFENWSFCGPTGTLEVADSGWPEDWENAGNSVALGEPVTDLLFPFYWFAVYGFEDAYLGTGINPTGGYAGFVSDDNPGFLDEIDKFGTVRWYTPGENTCPEPPALGACCLTDGTCQIMLQGECEGTGINGIYQGDDTTCDVACGACCYWKSDIDGLGRKCVVTTQTDCEEGSWNDIKVLVEGIPDSVGANWSHAGAECANNAGESEEKWWCQDPRDAVPTETTSWGKLKSLFR